MQDALPPQVIAITSGKGGVGKTTVSVNLAAALVKLDRNVMLMDADLGLSNVEIHLGLKPRYNLSHVLTGERTLNEVVIEGPGGILVVPAVSGRQHMAELSQMEHAGLIHAFSELNREIDTLIIDTAAGISDNVINFCQAAREVIIVLSDDNASLADSYSLIKVLNQDHAVQKFHVLTNMVETSADGFLLYQRLLNATDRFLQVDIGYLGAVPRDGYVRHATQRQRLLLQSFPQSSATRAFTDLAQRISQWSAPTTPSGGMEFFLERLVAQTV